MKSNEGPFSHYHTPRPLRVTACIMFFVLLVFGGFQRCFSPSKESVATGDDDIAGVVSGPNGAEAGVWVIAETHDLATRYAKTVVTNDKGEYLIPDLPDANYQVWVRGYGLIDSPKKEGKRGTTLNFEAVPAPDEHAAAQYYPAGYWFSLLQVPDRACFRGQDLKEMGSRQT